MKTYNEVFLELKKKKEGALVAFVVIGDPDYRTSLEIAKKIVDSGADMLELGIPFSDPIADGPTIQEADIRALDNGMNMDKAFEFVNDLRKHTDVPIGILCYYNLIYQYGLAKFYLKAKACGINSVLIADVPLEELSESLEESSRNDMDSVLMISPLTSDERISKIVSKTSGFIYAVSRLGVTGAKTDLHSSTLQLVKRIKKYSDKPLFVGFGISNPEHVKAMIDAGADGAIVGSAIVDIIGKGRKNKNKMIEDISIFIKRLKNATKRKR
jgi:tryptophan synthase alpha chain